MILFFVWQKDSLIGIFVCKGTGFHSLFCLSDQRSIQTQERSVEGEVQHEKRMEAIGLSACIDSFCGNSADAGGGSRSGDNLQ